MTSLPEVKLGKKRLAYPVCDGWLCEFYIYAKAWLDYDANDDDDWIDPNPYHPRVFVMEPMCNHHKGEVGYGPYLSRPYWEAMVKMFGHSPELGVVSYDPDAVEPELVTCSLNTETSHEPDAEGNLCDIMEDIMLSRGLTIKPDVSSC